MATTEYPTVPHSKPQQHVPTLVDQHDLGNCLLDAIPCEGFEVHFSHPGDVLTFTRGVFDINIALDSDHTQPMQTRTSMFNYHPAASTIYSRSTRSEGHLNTASIALTPGFSHHLREQLELPTLELRHIMCDQSPQAQVLNALACRMLDDAAWRNSLVAESLAVMSLSHVKTLFTGQPHAEINASPGRYCPPRMQQVAEYIEAHLNNDLSLQTLADIACTSLFHFSRLFKQALGRSPHQYIIERRLERAKEQLATTSQPILHIALNCGFASQSHLNRLFKARYGVTPRQFRLEAAR